MDDLIDPTSPIAMLRDIHDLTSVPWWPPAPGWWLIGLVMLALVIGGWRFRERLRRLHVCVPVPGIRLGSWRWAAARALRDLARRARSGENVKKSAGELSELLRRIAMARFGRAACAGLTGPAWLDWLTHHDPRGFSWRERAPLLIEAPYAPEGWRPSVLDKDALLTMIDAAFYWLEARETGREAPRILLWRRETSGV